MFRRKYNSVILPDLLPYLHNKQGKHYPATDFLKRFFIYIITKVYTMGSL